MESSHLIFAVVTAFISLVISTSALLSGCDYNGQHYNTGDHFSPTPCKHCTCDIGNQTFCAVEDCFFTPCVDFVKDPTKCCPQCPNGPTCRAPDGTVVKHGVTYKPNDHTICRCPTNSFGFKGTVALCATRP